jgi:hypothetical protein
VNLFDIAEGVAQSTHLPTDKEYLMYCTACGRGLMIVTGYYFKELKECSCSWHCCEAAEPGNRPHPVHRAYEEV